MGLMPIYQKPNTSKPAKGHKTYPVSAARECGWTRPNQVWAADITYLPMRRGLSLPGRHYGLAHPQGAGLADIEYAGGRLLRRGTERGHGHRFGRTGDHEHRPRQRSITSFAWTDRLRRSGVRISMDGKGRFLDNIFVEQALAIPEIRMRLPACLGNRLGGSHRDRKVGRVLQSQAPT